MSVMSNAQEAAVSQAQEVDHHEEEFRKKLMLDPIPQSDMNRMVIDSLNRIDKTFVITMLVLALVAGGGFLGGFYLERI